MTSRFVGPIAAPCSFPLRGFCSRSLAPTPTNRRPSRTGGRATFEKNSMAPNGRSPYPCSGHGLPACEKDREKTKTHSSVVAHLCAASPASPASPIASPACLPGQQSRSLTKQLDHCPVFPRQVPPQPIPFRLFMHGSYFCGSPKLLTSSADWVAESSFLFCVSSSQVSQSVDQPVGQSVNASRARVFCDPFPSLIPQLWVF